MKYHAIIDVVPVTWKRHDKYGRNNPKYTAYKKLLQEELWVHNHETNNLWPARYSGIVKLSLRFSGKNLRGDVDNYAKAVMDSIQEVLIVNDRQVKKLDVELVSGGSKLEITLEEI